MSKLKRAILHIGFEKTGTTSLLATMKKSRKALAAAGILFPDNAHDHTFLAMVFGLDERQRLEKAGQTDPRLWDAFKADQIAGLERQVAAFDGEVLLFSAESLAALPPASVTAMTQYLATLAEEVLVVAYVRHPVEQAASLSQQLVKSGHARLAEVDASPRYRQYEPRLAKYLDAVGRDRMIVVPFEREALKIGSVQADLLARIGAPHASSLLTMEDRNESLTTPGVVLKSLMDQADPTLRLRRRPLARIGGPKFALTPNAAAKAAEIGASDLAYLAETFGITFRTPRRSERAPLDGVFTREVMKSIVSYGRTLERPQRRAFEAAVAAIREGDWYGARFAKRQRASPQDAAAD